MEEPLIINHKHLGQVEVIEVYQLQSELVVSIPGESSTFIVDRKDTDISDEDFDNFM